MRTSAVAGVVLLVVMYFARHDSSIPQFRAANSPINAGNLFEQIFSVRFGGIRKYSVSNVKKEMGRK